MKKRHMSNLGLLGVFIVAALGPAQPVHAQPSAEGQWDDVLSWPLKAIHMVVLKNGNVLAFDLPIIPPDAPDFVLVRRRGVW